MLLQVKFEGPLQDFGWLIPVPSLPTVTQASMEPFYELSLLTQRLGAARYAGERTGGGRGSASPADESVQVIETKTVGAYEISVLAADDAGSLARWLKANDYSIPRGNMAIVDECISKGWYFIAVKIHLPSSPTDRPSPAREFKVAPLKLAFRFLCPTFAPSKFPRMRMLLPGLLCSI